MDALKYTTVVLLLWMNLAYSQEPTDQGLSASTHKIAITIGVNQIKEANLLSWAHSGFITTLSYGCTHSQENYRDFRFLLGYSRIIARAEDVTKSANILIGTSYSYAFKMTERRSLTYFLGPLVNLSYSVGAYPNWDDSHLYWANDMSVGINNVLIYTLRNETQLVSHVSMPLLSLFSRPDLMRLNKFDDMSFGGIVKNLHSNMNLGFWDSAFRFHADIELRFPIFRSEQEAFFYSLDIVRLHGNVGNPYTQLIHQIGMKVML